MLGKIERYLLTSIREKGSIFIPLIDPEEVTAESASLIAEEGERAGASAIMVGGSTLVSSESLDNIVKSIKESVKIPVILFPNNITGISRYADAIWFMSLLNSADPYFIIGAQVLAAPLIKKFHIEPIPLGYMILGEGGAAAVIGKACPIPYEKSGLAVAHALAAQFLGMRFIYLEGGSGVSKPVPSRTVRMVKSAVNLPLLVGGGIRTGSQAKEIVYAGADIIVASTALERSDPTSLRNKIQDIMEGIKEGAADRDINQSN
jgi:phosphoglycerol geranylgeranyltransferase